MSGAGCGDSAAEHECEFYPVLIHFGKRPVPVLNHFDFVNQFGLDKPPSHLILPLPDCFSNNLPYVPHNNVQVHVLQVVLGAPLDLFLFNVAADNSLSTHSEVVPVL